MALIHCNFYSDVLEISTAMYVILPENTITQIGMEGITKKSKHPTLYLLHGLSDDYTIWLRRTSIERYAAELGIAIVMPAVNRSFYTDMVHGYKYWTYVSQELIKKAREFFPLSQEREDTFVAGLSMGGYGALKLGLRCPEVFCATASLSGATDVEQVYKHGFTYDADLVFGTKDQISGSENDLFKLLKDIKKSNHPKPKIYQCCGTEDFLYKDNIKFKKACEKSGLDYTYEEEPGVHDWAYWDVKIQSVLQWLPIKK
jgi:putative tributyrin esterase